MSWKSITRSVLKFLHDNWLPVAMLISIIIGVCLGMGLKKTKSLTIREIMYIGFPGDIFLTLLKGVCIPLTACCIITAFSSLETSLAKIFGMELTVYIVATKLVSLTLVLTVALLMKPGKLTKVPLQPKLKVKNIYKKEVIDSFLDIIMNIFPNNMFDVFFRQTTTNITTDENNETRYDKLMIDGTNMLGVVSLSIVIGIALKTMGPLNKPILDVIAVVGHITFIIVKLIMYIAPVMLVFLITKLTLETEFKGLVSSTGIYALAVSGIMFIQMLIFYPLILFCAKTNPIRFYLGYLEVIVTSFACSSSIASLPVAIKSMKEKMGYEENLVSFVLPICFNINKDGAVTTLAFATIFFAQYTDTPLQVSDYFIIGVFATACGLATPGVPAGIFIILIVMFEPLSIPTAYIPNIMAVDILVDRVATMENVLGSGVCAAVVNNFSKKKLAHLTEQTEDNKHMSLNRENAEQNFARLSENTSQNV